MKLHNVQIPDGFPVASVMVADDGTVSINLRAGRGVAMVSIDGKSMYAHSAPHPMDTVVVRTRPAVATAEMPTASAVGAKRRR